MRALRLCLLPLCLLVAAATHATDLGVIGKTYPIAEQHFLKMIEEMLRRKAAAGELDELNRKFKQRAMSKLENPSPVDGVVRTTKPATHYWDPSTRFDETITDPEGRVIVAAGTVVNPLDTVAVTRNLLFFDGRDQQQIKFARRYLDAHEGKVKPVIVGGSFMALMREWKQAVYYDQGGFLVNKLGIRQVPAIVSQEGRVIRIDEVLPK
jgi:conjugal transfer pilus assembly protein TraW